MTEQQIQMTLMNSDRAFFPIVSTRFSSFFSHFFHSFPIFFTTVHNFSPFDFGYMHNGYGVSYFILQFSAWFGRQFYVTARGNR